MKGQRPLDKIPLDREEERAPPIKKYFLFPFCFLRTALCGAKTRSEFGIKKTKKSCPPQHVRTMQQSNQKEGGEEVKVLCVRSLQKVNELAWKERERGESADVVRASPPKKRGGGRCFFSDGGGGACKRLSSLLPPS